MIHATICIKTELINSTTISSAGLILRYIKDDAEIEKKMSIYFGNCNNYSAYARAALVTLAAISPEFSKEQIKLMFDKGTHLTNLIKSKKKDEVVARLQQSLKCVEYEFIKPSSDHENRLLVQAATLASRSFEQKASTV